jgi:hypothetical protein
VEVDGEVAVGVVDDPPGGEPGHGEAGLLLQLASRASLGGLSTFDLPAGELPEPAQEPSERPRLHQPSASPRQGDHGPPELRPRRRRAATRQLARVGELLTRSAEGGDRADLASGRDRSADGLAELHDRLVERSGGLGRQKGREPALEAPPDRR